MQNYIDFTPCEILEEGSYNGSNGTKKCIIYNNKIYMLKFYDTDKKYTNSAVSEYISCHIFDSIGIKTQQTLLGKYITDGVEYQAVACEDFILNDKSKILDLKDFASFKNKVVNSSSNGYGTELADIVESISQLNIMDSIKIENFFWDMFIVDALLGNFDRHNGNWGFLVDRITRTVDFAPIYDCGSCLYSALSEENMIEYLNDKEHTEINKRVYVFPNSAIKMSGVKINYYDFINSMENSNCNDALLRIMPRINIDKINSIIDDTPYISDIRKTFYKTILSERYEKILVPAYEKLLARQKSVDTITNGIEEKYDADIDNDRDPTDDFC